MVIFLLKISEISCLFPTTKPPIKSECPPRYFEAECITRSNPIEIGLQAQGLANVLSQIAIRLCFLAIAAMASRSHTLRTGLVMVSTYRSFVLFLIAAS